MSARQALLAGLAGLAALLPAVPLPAEVQGAELLLEVWPLATPGFVPAAAPPRFVLLGKGQFYVGGSAEIASGQLDSREAKDLGKRLDRLRKLPGLGSQVALGPGDTSYRLTLSGKRPLTIVATGDPATAPRAIRPLADLLAELAAFEHPSLRIVQPQQLAVSARDERLDGGCRSWSLPVPLRAALSGPQLVPQASAAGWPRGAWAASVCDGDRRYAVTLRPLLPGERP
ncbi:MAG: hypothetical protein AB7O37_04535 [Vicinamibacteria bacterium]